MHPCLIVGQGLIGTIAAWELTFRNIPFHIIDADLAGAASPVAAGMINPIMGPKLKLVDQGAEALSHAKIFYEKISHELGCGLFESKKILRIFDSQDQLDLYQSYRENPLYTPYWGQYQPSSTLGNDPYGSVEVLGGGILNVRELLHKSRNLWKQKNIFLTEKFQHQDLHLNGNSQWIWNGQSYGSVIFAEGLGASKNPFFSEIKLRPTQGEIFTFQVRLPDNCKDIWLQKNWLIPIDKTTCKIGATYQWTEDPQPTAQATAELLQAFKQFLPKENLRIILEKESGIRMCTPTTHPITVRHAVHNNLIFANGFGSKGALLGPLMIYNLLNEKAL